MQKLSERLEGYSISTVLKEYCADLREVEAEEKACLQQPISRYESDFVSVTSAKELSAAYRKDYIRDVHERYEDYENLVAQKVAAVNEKVTSATPTDNSRRNLLDEMRLHFNDGNKNVTLSDLELLAQLDDYLERIDRSKRGYAELLKSVPLAAFSAYKEKLSKKSESTSLSGVSVQNLSTSSEIKEPGRRRGGFKRKLVSSLCL